MTRGRLFVALVVLALGAMWVYVLLPSSRRDPPNRLDDPQYGQAAEQICQVTRDVIDTLPRADVAQVPADRGEVVSRANDLLDVMLQKLSEVPPITSDDGVAISRWLDDWRIYLADREAWAVDLLAGKDEQFFETAADGGPISDSLRDFADVNGMPSCAPPPDV
jgi:hypothetical protein